MQPRGQHPYSPQRSQRESRQMRAADLAFCDATNKSKTLTIRYRIFGYSLTPNASQLAVTRALGNSLIKNAQRDPPGICPYVTAWDAVRRLALSQS